MYGSQGLLPGVISFRGEGHPDFQLLPLAFAYPAADGLGDYDESEAGIPDFLDQWKAGSSVEVKAFHRGNDAAPYISGNFIITSLEISEPAGEDTTYSITLDNDGAVTVDGTKFGPASSQGGGDDEN